MLSPSRIHTLLTSRLLQGTSLSSRNDWSRNLFPSLTLRYSWSGHTESDGDAEVKVIELRASRYA